MLLIVLSILLVGGVLISAETNNFSQYPAEGFTGSDPLPSVEYRLGLTTGTITKETWHTFVLSMSSNVLRYVVAYQPLSTSHSYISTDGSWLGRLFNTAGSTSGTCWKYVDYTISTNTWSSVTTRVSSGGGMMIDGDGNGQYYKLLFSSVDLTHHAYYFGNEGWTAGPLAVPAGLLMSNVIRLNPALVNNLATQDGVLGSIWFYVKYAPDFIGAVFESMIDSVTTAVEAVTTAVSIIASGVWGYFEDGFAVLQQATSNILSAVSGVAVGIWNQFSSVLNSVKNAVDDINESIASYLAPAITPIMDKVLLIYDLFMQVTEEVIYTVTIPLNLLIWFKNVILDLTSSLFYWFGALVSPFPGMIPGMITINIVLVIFSTIYGTIFKFARLIVRV
jgi:hypothetical protein